MKFVFNGTVQSVTVESAEEVVAVINELLGDTYYLQSLRVNGGEVYEELEQYIANHFTTIETIEVDGVLGELFIPQLIETGEGYLLRLQDNLPAVIDVFDRGGTSEAWASLSDFFGGMQWLLSMQSVVDESKERPNMWSDVVAQGNIIAQSLPAVEKAVEREDTNHLVSIFKEALVPALRTYQQLFTDVLEHEVKRPTSQ